MENSSQSVSSLSELSRSLALESQLVNRNLSDLIFEVDILRMDLGISRWEYLRDWADGTHPKDCSEDELELLQERLCVRWSDG